MKVKTEFLRKGGEFVIEAVEEVRKDSKHKAIIVLQVDTSLEGIIEAENTLLSIVGRRHLVRALIQHLAEDDDTEEIFRDLAFRQALKGIISKTKGSDNE